MFLAYFSMLLWENTPKAWLLEENSLEKRPLRFIERKKVFLAFLSMFLIICHLKPTCNMFFYFILIQQCLSDGFYHILQDQWSLLLGFLGLLNLKNENLLAAILIFLLWLFLAFISALLKKSCPLGLGDAKLLAALALSKGFFVFKIFIYASLFSGLFALFLVISKKVKQEDKIAFGPFIAMAAFYL